MSRVRYRCCMARPRKHIVCLDSTPYYHVTARCVRRAFLCGVDQYSGKSYQHRRAWVEDRVRVLASLFFLDICAYAIMSNHYHLVVKLRPQAETAVSDHDVLQRWLSLFRGPLLVQRHAQGEPLTPIEQDTVRAITAQYRKRLHSLSWFMKCLNEPIARRANAEDQCSGHFWEARFHSQPLTSDRALITAMAYVDLNPVRAGLAKAPEHAPYTSLQARLRPGEPSSSLTAAVTRLLETGELNHFQTAPRPLMPFARPGQVGVGPAAEPTLPLYEAEYLTLVDLTGRCVVSGKRGRIAASLPPVLQRLGLTVEEWTSASSAFSDHYRRGDLRLVKTA